MHTPEGREPGEPWSRSEGLPGVFQEVETGVQVIDKEGQPAPVAQTKTQDSVLHEVETLRRGFPMDEV